MSSTFEAYQLYLSLKAHFTRSSYDHLKNHPRNATLKALARRKDIWCFEKLARMDDLEKHLIANFIIDPEMWPEYLVRSDARANYVDYQKRIQSLSYVFSEDLKRLNPDFDSNIKIEESGTHPPLLLFLIRGNVCIETVIIIAEITNVLPHWNEKMKGDIVWEELKLKFKYGAFLDYDKEHFRRILVGYFGGVDGDKNPNEEHHNR